MKHFIIIALASLCVCVNTMAQNPDYNWSISPKFGFSKTTALVANEFWLDDAVANQSSGIGRFYGVDLNIRLFKKGPWLKLNGNTFNRVFPYRRVDPYQNRNTIAHIQNSKKGIEFGLGLEYLYHIPNSSYFLSCFIVEKNQMVYKSSNLSTFPNGKSVRGNEFVYYLGDFRFRTETGVSLHKYLNSQNKYAFHVSPSFSFFNRFRKVKTIDKMQLRSLGLQFGISRYF